jgi:uroporphyrinogen decarboxylase
MSDAAAMSKPERVSAALRGDEVDRVPVSAWWHDFAREWSPQDLADATLDAYREYDFDFVKVNPRATYFGEAWGAQYVLADPPNQQPRLIAPGVSSPDDLRRIDRVDVALGPFEEQLEALGLIAHRLKGEAPFLQTVFSPLASMSRITGSTKYVQKLVREAPDDLLAALGPISETLAAYAAACLERGAAGIFFATVEWASTDNLSPEEYDRFGRPFDLPVLEAVRDAPFNVLHVCRDNNMLARLLDYPVHALQWGSRSPANPSLTEIAPKTDRALLGGVDHTETIRTGSQVDVTVEAHDAIAGMDRRRLLLAPECSIDPTTPPENIRAMIDEARA